MYAVFSVLQGYLPLFGINERFLLVIEGKTGELKSSSAKVATDIFQRGPSVSLSSTKTAILENLWQFGNIPVLLDDYNKSSFTHTMRSKGITLSEIIQSYYDRNTIQKMDGKQMKEYSIQSGIVITTEGMPKNISTLNRCLIVSSEGAIDSKRLKAAQERNRQKHMFSGLVMDLNMYLVKHLDQLQNMVRSNFLEFRDGSAALPRKNSDGTVNRVKNTYALAMTAAYVFQQYMGYKKLNPQTLNKVYRTMQQAVQSACLDMCDLMSPGEPSHEYIDCIDNIYDRDWSEKAVKNPKKYFKMQNYHSGILSEDSSIFYIQGQKLIESLQRELEKPVTKKAVSQELRDFGFLAVDADGKNSTRLPGFGTTYRTRFYAIRIKMLQEWCRDTFWETLNDEMRQEEMTR
jgi:hypothetical protein